MRLAFGLLALLCSGGARAEGGLFDATKSQREPFAQCASSEHATLWRSANLPLLPTHDGPEGSTSFQLRSQGKVIATRELDGNGVCLGYAAAAHAFVVASKHEVGDSVVLASLELLSDSGTLKDTAFERDSYIAYAMVASASHRYVAFVGGHSTGSVRLYAVDLVGEKIHELGAAPAPPPDRDAEHKHPWRWGPDGVGWATDLEPEILSFDGEILHVSYGKDTWQKRATERTPRVWNVATQ